jgi:hypothetical protein
MNGIDDHLLKYKKRPLGRIANVGQAWAQTSLVIPTTTGLGGVVYLLLKEKSSK